MGGETRCTGPQFTTSGVAEAEGAPGNDTGAHRARSRPNEMKRLKGPHTDRLPCGVIFYLFFCPGGVSYK
jgi:hypothetical protein